MLIVNFWQLNVQFKFFLSPQKVLTYAVAAPLQLCSEDELPLREL